MRALYAIKETITESKDLVSSLRPVIIIIVMVIIQALVGKLLWNKALVPLISVIKPMKNWYDIIGISVLFNMINL
jgi:ABC-type polysaccharide/polyol phosphate export permease